MGQGAPARRDDVPQFVTDLIQDIAIIALGLASILNSRR